MSWFVDEYDKKWLKIPESFRQLYVAEDIFARCGILGCVASMDVVHVELGACPARDKRLYVGKEGYPTLGFIVCVGHNLHVERVFGILKKRHMILNQHVPNTLPLYATGFASYDDMDTEKDLDFEGFRNCLVEHLQYKLSKGEV